MSKKFGINEKGYYGNYGGAYIPEMLRQNIVELTQKYQELICYEPFKLEYAQLLREYVGRPSLLYKAQRLSDKYQTQIYLKREDLNHTGSHKINNTVGQILLAKYMGKKRVIAETGAGQHGVATATVCALMGLQCEIFMGEIDMIRQAPNVKRMEMLGAVVRPATSGSKTLKDAVNEALRDWICHPYDTFYLMGSVLGPHPYPDIVTHFQKIIGEEIRIQLAAAIGKDTPDYLLACVGGGSNATGAFYDFLDDEQVQLIAVEAAGKGVFSGETAATSVVGTPGIIHGFKTLLMQNQDGQITEPYSISAGLDYPGIGPLFAHLHDVNRVQFMHATDEEALTAAFELTRLEGIIPALESAHALAVLNKKKFNSNDVVVINLSGRGDKDLETYIQSFNKMNYE